MIKSIQWVNYRVLGISLLDTFLDVCNFSKRALVLCLQETCRGYCKKAALHALHCVIATENVLKISQTSFIILASCLAYTGFKFPDLSYRS